MMTTITRPKATMDYERFKFLNFNRKAINQGHVRKLMESIKARNLLHLRPIDVNKDMEVLDGQHRLIAAKSLGVEIHYNVVEDASSSDIILMNVQLNWNNEDRLNYFVKNNFPEYVKLQSFMSESGLALKIALALLVGYRKNVLNDFKVGKFEFPAGERGKELDYCHATCDLIKRHNTACAWTKGSKFWSAMIKLFQQETFDWAIWEKKIPMLSHKWGPKITLKEYWHMILGAYNYRNHNKILDEMVEEDLI